MRLSPRHLAALTFLLAAPGLFAGETAAPAVPALSGKLGEPIQLFNGKNLDGWTWVVNAPEGGGEKLKEEAVWSVKDGVMHQNSRKETPGFMPGYLRAEPDFTNFVLTVEQRHVTKGGGGILVGITGPDKVWPRTFQIQGASGHVGDFVNQGNFKMAADAGRTKTAKNGDIQTAMSGPNSEKPMGEWDTVEITVDHGNVWVKVNGVVQNVAKDAEPLTGKIGLQAEGAEMEFRKMEVRPIE